MNKMFTPMARNTSNDLDWFDVHTVLPNPESIGEDGKDHINMKAESQTTLGHDLSHLANIPFEHHKYGRFASVNNFWYYIRTVERDDRLRTYVGKRLMTFVRNLTTVMIPNFRVIIMDANWQKVQQTKGLADAIRESTLPFDCWHHYRRGDGIRTRPNYAHWLIAGFEEIRKALKENREPDFGFLRDTDDDDIFELADATVKAKWQQRKS